MTDIALLGFAVDSKPLDTARQQAKAAAQEIGALGDKADKASAQLTNAAKAGGTAGRSASDLERQMRLAGAGAQSFGTNVASAGKGAHAASDGVKSLLANAAALSPQIQAAAGSVGGLAASLSGVGGGSVGGGLTGGLAAAGRGIVSVAAGLGPMGILAGAAASGALALGAAYYKAAEGLAVYQDRQTQNIARLKNALGEGADAAGTVQALQQQANEAGIAADATIDAFARIARNGEALGASTDQLLQLSETVQKLGIVSNASAGEISSGQLQLSQALASGKLNGDELRSVMENLPALAKAIADGLGVSVGQLRSMGAAGELTGDKVFRSLLSQTDKVREEFKSLPDTTERAFTRLENQSNKFKARLGEIIGASQLMQSILNSAAATLAELNGDVPNTVSAVQSRINELTAGKLDPANNAGGVVNFFLGRGKFDSDRLAQSLEDRKEIDALAVKLAQLEKAALSTKARDARRANDAELNRIDAVAKDIDDVGTRKAKLATNAETLKQGIILAKKEMAEAANEAKRYADEVSGLNSAIAYQLGRTFNPLNTTENYVAMFLATGKGQLGDKRDVAEKQRAAAQARTDKSANRIKQYEASAVVNDKSIESSNKADPAGQRRDELASLERQTQAQLALAAAVGKGRAATRELEVAQEAAEYRVRTFGTKTTPDAINATNAYASATRALKAAQDSVADARAFQAIKDNIAGIKQQTEAVIYGGFAMRKAAADQAAALADRETPGLGSRKKDAFAAQEELNTAQMLFKIEVDTLRARAQFDAIGDAGAEKRLALAVKIQDAQRDSAPEKRAEIEAAIREQEAANDDNYAERQNQIAIKRQALLSDEFGLIQYTGRELAVQTALLQKRLELEGAGVNMASAYTDFQLQTAGAIAAQVFDNELIKGRVDELRATFGTAFDGFRSAASGVFSDMFRNGEISGARFFERLNDGLSSFVERLMDQLIFNPLFDSISNRGGTGLLDGLLNSGASALGGAFGGDEAFGSSASFESLGKSLGFANGGAFLGGHEVALANGGILHGPTMFGLSGGRSGVAGEAGAEGVLPLRRGPSGKLGVEASGAGGGTTVQIIDMRTGAEAEPVQVKERQSSTGERMIQLMIRDNVKASVRSGSLDTDMKNSYSVARPVIRR